MPYVLGLKIIEPPHCLPWRMSNHIKCVIVSYLISFQRWSCKNSWWINEDSSTLYSIIMSDVWPYAESHWLILNRFEKWSLGSDQCVREHRTDCGVGNFYKRSHIRKYFFRIRIWGPVILNHRSGLPIKTDPAGSNLDIYCDYWKKCVGK